MLTDHPIPVDERLLRWLQSTSRGIQHGSITLEIEQGKLKSLSCHGHRFIYSLDEWQESVE